MCTNKETIKISMSTIRSVRYSEGYNHNALNVLLPMNVKVSTFGNVANFKRRSLIEKFHIIFINYNNTIVYQSLLRIVVQEQ